MDFDRSPRGHRRLALALQSSPPPTAASAISPHSASLKTSIPKARAPFWLRPYCTQALTSPTNFQLVSLQTNSLCGPVCVTRQDVSTEPPTKATGRNHVWFWDFIHDRTDNGGPLRMMTLIDEYTRKCLSVRVARQLPSTDVLSVLSEAIEEEGAHSYIRSDNGSEFIAHQVQQCLANKNIKAIYSDPGRLPNEASPQRAKARITNGFIESFI